MAQRTVFPAIPNTADAAYLAFTTDLFRHLRQAGGTVGFKPIRSWFRERNAWDKQQIPELLDFLGCPFGDSVSVSDFGARLIDAEGPEGQQRVLYLWLKAWNPFLVKTILELLDVDGGGRLHSTHEMYRVVTSYAYAGDYVKLPDFQAWIKWAVASGVIRMIGIRWGLSETGKAEIPMLRQIDIDELLEEEEEERERQEAETLVADAPIQPAAAIPAEAFDPPEDDLPDMPPEAPTPVWEEPEAPAAVPPTAPVPASGVEPPAKPASIPSGAAMRRGPSASPPAPRAPHRAPVAPGPHLGVEALNLDPKQYGGEPGWFVLRLAIGARLALHAPVGRAWLDFYAAFCAPEVLGRWFREGRAVEEVLADAGWFTADRDLLGLVLPDALRIGATLLADADLCVTLEESADLGVLSWRLHQRFYAGEDTPAPYWIVRAMTSLELWDNPPPTG